MEQRRELSPTEWRAAFRQGRAQGQTSALAPGYQQANIAIVPAAVADEFEAFLRANPLACPLLARGRAGDPGLPELGADIDIRSDLPRYRLFDAGYPAGLLTDVTDAWRDDFVPFAIGCSLSFEADLVAGGVALRCHAPGVSCSAFDSSIPNHPAGCFGGNMVVSMRAVPADQVDLATELTRRHPEAHGAPVHAGDPARIGVNLSRPIDGLGLTDIRAGEVPVFWACGVTLERAIESAGLTAITHAPGHMLITDLPTGQGRG
ncbi:D-glutamate cyclase family protein [Paracoccus saliphilus]|uniref:DUF1445 domain-containing protein n=1 Tax=Paracoccus saliphilus TaxID=405559 RepID=A0AA45W2F6_9RHOB|nr:DUF1445 domain-containing protein [Paracoccus saliphilus]WCR01986.1 DUF1445 domain-containing protein [Paracoccus saliphilus]SIS66108.1 Uncharacterized protein YcsI, UPF0317 family [Paracoccus saliphilus]